MTQCNFSSRMEPTPVDIFSGYENRIVPAGDCILQTIAETIDAVRQLPLIAEELVESAGAMKAGRINQETNDRKQDKNDADDGMHDHVHHPFLKRAGLFNLDAEFRERGRKAGRALNPRPIPIKLIMIAVVRRINSPAIRSVAARNQRKPAATAGFGNANIRLFNGHDVVRKIRNGSVSGDVVV